jgi:Protein of unknown function (DUF3592)
MDSSIDVLLTVVPWLGIGSGILVWSCRHAHVQASATATWVPVKAQVSGRYQLWCLDQSSDSDGKAGFNRCTLQYTYRFNNVDYNHRSHWVASHDSQVDTPEPSLLAYEVGDAVEVFVDPQHPYQTALYLSTIGNTRTVYWAVCAVFALCAVAYATGHVLVASENESSLLSAARHFAAGVAKYLFYFSACAYFFVRSKRNETENVATWIKATGRIRRGPPVTVSTHAADRSVVEAPTPSHASSPLSVAPVLPPPTSYTYDWGGLPYTGTFNIRWYDPSQIDVSTDFPDGQLIPILVNPDKPSESVNWIERQGHLRALTRLWGWLAVGGFVVMWFG